MLQKLRDYPVEMTLYILGLIGGAILVSAYFVIHLFSISLPEIPCTFHELTGYYCPGCGGTHAIAILFSGHIVNAVHYNAFAVYIIVCYLLFMLSYSIHILSKKKDTLYTF